MATDSGRDASVRSRMSAPHILPANPRRRLLAALPLALTIAVIAPPVARAAVSVIVFSRSGGNAYLPYIGPK